MNDLTPDEIKRYSRHLVLKNFGAAGQRKLRQAKVLIVGAGGLGSPALLYLSAAGVGTIGIADSDDLDISNLQRQVLFSTEDIGKNKAETAARKLKLLNPLIEIKSYPFRIDSTNALEVLKLFDIIVDGTDNFPTRYLLNDACVLLNKPLVYGSILEFEGQVGVFNYRSGENSFTGNYRDIFPEPPDPETVPNCEQAGVLGVLPGIIGTLQANEVVKLITGLGELLVDRLLIFDSLYMEQTIIRTVNHNAREQIKNLIDYENFCGINQDKNKSLGMKEITVQELKELKDAGSEFQLIDVREPHEYDICNLEGELIPMSEIPYNVEKISRDKKVVMHCRSGKRSGDMIIWLERNHGFENLYNLKGGVLAWAREIDPEMPTY